MLQGDAIHADAPRLERCGFDDFAGVWSGKEAADVLAACGIRAETIGALVGTLLCCFL